MDPKTISDAFHRIETENGGYAEIAADEVAEQVAQELGLSSAEVHAVMVDEWTMVRDG